MSAEISGYIIANRHWDAVTQLEMGKGTFGKTAADAWTLHLQSHQRISQDRPIFIQRWSDRGYGPVRATLRIDA